MILCFISIIMMVVFTGELTAQPESTVLFLQDWEIHFFSQKDEHFGSISKLTSPQSADIFSTEYGPGLFQWVCGEAHPRRFHYALEQDALICEYEAFQKSNGDYLPLYARLNIKANPNELLFDCLLRVNSLYDFQDGLSLLIPLETTGRIDLLGAAGDISSWLIRYAGTRHLRKPYQNLAYFQSAAVHLNLLLRQPLFPTLRLHNEGADLEILIANEPNTSQPSGLDNISSVLHPGDIVCAEWAVSASAEWALAGKGGNPAFFTAHPQAAEQSVVWAFDNIPMIEPQWAVPTNETNPHTPFTSNLLHLLNIFPDVKYTWLLLTDNISRLGNWYFKDWWPPTANVLPDSQNVRSGNYSCKLVVDTLWNNDPAMIVPIVSVEPQRDYAVGGWFKSDIPLANDNSLIITVMTWPGVDIIKQTVFTPNCLEWTPLEVGINTGEGGVIAVNFRFQGSPGSIYFDDAYCRDLVTGENAFPNPGFEQFKPYITYQPADNPIWPNARGPWRIAAEAPPEYKRWLQCLQNESADWSYSSRIGLGLHGLHHTPDAGFQQEGNRIHEFDRFDPFGDSLRIANITTDLQDIGLDPSRIIKFFRFPGHRHTTSLLRPIIAKGCRIIDHGILAPPVVYHGRIFRESGFIWQVNSLSWHDEVVPDFLANLKSQLDMGAFALMGVHYQLLSNWSETGAKEDAIQFLSWLESDYPYLKWLKAEKWADFWDELGAIKNIRQTEFGTHIQLTWEGASFLGETVMTVLSDSSLVPVRCSIDRIDQPWIQRGRRVFVVLPELDAGRHTLELFTQTTKSYYPAPEMQYWKIGFTGRNTLALHNLPPSSEPVHLQAFNLLGQMVFEKTLSISLNSEQVYVSLPNLASGWLLLRIEQDGQHWFRTLTLKK